MMDRGRTDVTMDMEPVYGRMVESIRVNGNKAWHTGKGLRRIQMAQSVTKVSGEMMNPYVDYNGT